MASKLVIHSNFDGLMLADPFTDIFNAPIWDRTLTTPAINIAEDEEGYELMLAAPGLDKDDFRIDVEDGTLSISAEKDESYEENEEEYSSREYNHSSFSRSFSLPDDVIEDEIEAEYTDGILRLTLPKKEASEKDVQNVTITVL